MFGVRFRSLKFSDGTEVPVPPEGVMVLVGPNNAGKSVALREILRQLTDHPMSFAENPTRVVVAASVEREGTSEDLYQWLTNHSFTIDRRDGRYFQRAHAGATSWSILSNEWSMADQPMPNLARFFNFFAAADQRLTLIAETGMYDPLSDAPAHPMQVLYARPDLERRVSEVSFEAFGNRVTLARIPGSNLRLHMGTTDAEATLPPNRPYLEAIRSLPLVQEQGDGVRSFLGIMIALITAQYPLLFLDEPEAFLHPPQARLLGRKLGGEVPQRTQLFVATHDGDILQGLLNSGIEHITIVRLVRDGNINQTRVLPADDVRMLWGDPLLRYSNVLQGLFHRGVVASESDADSRYYAAVLDAVGDDEKTPPHDLLFTQSGGKARLRTVVRALRAIDIPVAVILDFDALREGDLLRDLVVLQGGDWSGLADRWRIVKSAVEQLGAAPLRTAVREEIERLLAASASARITRSEAEQIRAITRVDDAWRQAKRGGVGVLPQGQPSEAAEALLEDLATLGIFVVPVGELERWHPEVAGHGPEWVSNVLSSGRHEVADAPSSRFMRRVAAFFDRPVPPEIEIEELAEGATI